MNLARSFRAGDASHQNHYGRVATDESQPFSWNIDVRSFRPTNLIGSLVATRRREWVFEFPALMDRAKFTRSLRDDFVLQYQVIEIDLRLLATLLNQGVT